MRVQRRKANRSKGDRTASSSGVGSRISPMSSVRSPMPVLPGPSQSVGSTFPSGLWTLDIGRWAVFNLPAPISTIIAPERPAALAFLLAGQ